MDCEEVGLRHIRGIAVGVVALSILDLIYNGMSLISTDGSRVSIFIPGGLLGLVLAWRLWVGAVRAVNWTQRVAAFVVGFAGLALVVFILRLPWDAGLAQIVGMERVNAIMWAALGVTATVGGVIVWRLRGIPVRDYLSAANARPARTWPSATLGSALALTALLTLYNAVYRDPWNIGHQLLRDRLSTDLQYHVLSFRTRVKDEDLSFIAAVGAYDNENYCVGEFAWTGRQSGEESYHVEAIRFRPAYGACEEMFR